MAKSAKKIILAFTAAALASLSTDVLKAVYKDTSGKDAAEGLDQKGLIDAILEIADPAPEPEVLVVDKQPLLTFKNKKTGKKYEVLIPKVEIPGMGIRTALEITADDEAQDYLIKNGCIGSVISEV